MELSSDITAKAVAASKYAMEERTRVPGTLFLAISGSAMTRVDVSKLMEAA
jgi:hypothetical protein